MSGAGATRVRARLQAKAAALQARLEAAVSVVRSGHQSLGPATLVGQWERMRQHARAGSGPLDVRAHLHDLACCLDAKGQRRGRPHVPAAGADDLVPVRHSGSLDLDQDLAGLEGRDLRQLKKLDLARERLHASGSETHAQIMPGPAFAALCRPIARKPATHRCLAQIGAAERPIRAVSTTAPLSQGADALRRRTHAPEMDDKQQPAAGSGQPGSRHP
jgi:hypothetical protein